MPHELLLAIEGISLASLGPIVEKWSLKALESSLGLEITASFNFKSGLLTLGLKLLRIGLSSQSQFYQKC